MKKERVINFIIGITVIFLVLYLVLCIYMVYIYLNDDDNHTLMAGIIGFTGAIIGGSITLLGVNKTIEYSKSTKLLEDSPINLERITNVITFLRNLYLNFEITYTKNSQEPSDTFRNALELMDNSDFIQMSARINPNLYIKTRDLRGALGDLYFKYNMNFDYEKTLEYYNSSQDCIAEIINNFKEEEKKLLKFLEEHQREI